MCHLMTDESQPGGSHYCPGPLPSAEPAVGIFLWPSPSREHFKPPALCPGWAGWGWGLLKTAPFCSPRFPSANSFESALLLGSTCLAPPAAGSCALWGCSLGVRGATDAQPTHPSVSKLARLHFSWAPPSRYFIKSLVPTPPSLPLGNFVIFSYKLSAGSHSLALCPQPQTRK